MFQLMTKEIKVYLVHLIIIVQVYFKQGKHNPVMINLPQIQLRNKEFLIISNLQFRMKKINNKQEFLLI